MHIYICNKYVLVLYGINCQLGDIIMSEERTIHLTKEEFDALISEARSEGYEDGYENGRHDGYNDGYEDAEED